MGSPVGFDSRSEMLAHYGPGGITDYPLQDGGTQISDNMQLTLFTANALLAAATRKKIGTPGGTGSRLLSGLTPSPSGDILPRRSKFRWRM